MNYVQKIIIIALAASATVAAASTPATLVDPATLQAFEKCKILSVAKTNGLDKKCIVVQKIYCCGVDITKSQKSAFAKHIKRSGDKSLLHRVDGRSKWLCLFVDKNKSSWILGHWKKSPAISSPYWTCQN